MTDESRTEKDIAQSISHDAYLVGIDDDGASHFWSSYDWKVIVIDGSDTDVHDLPRRRDLREWRDYVAEKRGWADCRIGGSIIEDIQTAAEVLR